MFGIGIGASFANAPAFSPISLGGLIAWYKTSNISLTAGKVSSWPDSSQVGDSNRNLSQATSGLRPSYTTSNPNFNNQPTVNFISASSTLLSSGTFSSHIPANSTWYCAISWAPNLQFIWNGIDGTNQQYTITGSPAGPDVLMGTGVGDFHSGSLTPSPGLTAPFILCAQYDPAGSNMFANNHVTAVASGTCTASTPAGVSLGGSYPGYGAFWADADVGEMLIFNNTHNVGERQKMMQYLGSKYGIPVT